MTLLLALGWLAGLGWFARNLDDSVWLFLLMVAAAMITVMIGAPGIWVADYSRDSFWTLGLVGRVGVMAISTIGFIAIFLFLAFKTRLLLLTQANRIALLALDLAIGVLIYAIIYSVSPQVFYSFYQFIFADLPSQIVVKSILDLDRLQTIAQLSPDGSLSDHLAGVGFWAIVPFTVWMHLRAAYHSRQRKLAR